MQVMQQRYIPVQSNNGSASMPVATLGGSASMPVATLGGSASMPVATMGGSASIPVASVGGYVPQPVHVSAAGQLAMPAMPRLRAASCAGQLAMPAMPRLRAASCPDQSVGGYAQPAMTAMPAAQPHVQQFQPAVPEGSPKVALELCVGDSVEYYSESSGGWIPAKIQVVNEAMGVYVLDVHPAAPASKVRKVRQHVGFIMPEVREQTPEEEQRIATIAARLEPQDIPGGPPPMRTIRKLLPMRSTDVVHDRGTASARVMKDRTPMEEMTPPEAQIFCPNGHLMHGEVAGEVIQPFQRKAIPCDGGCGSDIDYTVEFAYRCRSCNIDYCSDCAPELAAHGFERGESKHDMLRLVKPGDIFYIGPSAYNIHHTVLARSRVTEIEHDDYDFLLENFNIPNGKLFQCHTIESTQAESGILTPWYPARTIFAWDLDKETLKVVADIPEETSRAGDEPEISEYVQPCGVKVLLHPLKGDLLDKYLFNEAVLWGATEAKKYGKSQAVTAFLRSTLTSTSFKDMDISTKQRRDALREDLRARWQRPPICASLCIKVWQMYFELLGLDAASQLKERAEGQEEQDAARDDVLRQTLRFMPLYPDVTIPSELMKVLTKCGWELHDFSIEQ